MIEIMVEHTSLTEKFEALRPVLNELARRRWAATEARAFGRGGISAVARATGLSRKTIRAGIREMRHGALALHLPPRRRGCGVPGAGRKRRATQDPTLLGDLETLVEPTTRGDPQSPLRWTCKSVRRLAAELQAQGHQVSPQLVSELLQAAGYSLQGARKTREGTQHPDRNAQFEHIAALVQDFQNRGAAGHLGRREEESTGRGLQAPRGMSGTPKARLPRSACTISLTRRWARRSRMASMTCTRTSAGSALA